jgi:hypothetical protein
LRDHHQRLGLREQQELYFPRNLYQPAVAVWFDQLRYIFQCGDLQQPSKLIVVIAAVEFQFILNAIQQFTLKFVVAGTFQQSFKLVFAGTFKQSFKFLFTGAK